MAVFEQKIQRKLAAYFDGIEPSTTLVLTPNKRLSRYIHSQYSVYMEAKNSGAFLSLTCLSLSAWYSQLWGELVCLGGDDRRLLSPLQDTLIWEEIIAAHEPVTALLNVPSTAKLAVDAWRRVHEWCLTANQIALNDEQLFVGWCEAYQSHCEQRRLLSASELPHVILKQLVGATDFNAVSALDQLPSAIVLYGFDDFSPVVKKILERLCVLGISIEEISVEEKTKKICRYEFQDETHEIESVALWAKSIVMEQPQATLGIVAPGLASQKQKIERIFNRVFDPCSIFPSEPQYAPGYNMSAGQPLLNVPVVSAALLALKSMVRTIDINDASKFILSPFFGDEKELVFRALVDRKLREQGELEVGFAQIQSQLAGMVGANGEVLCPDFLQQIKAFGKQRAVFQNVLAWPSEWCCNFTEQLQILQWSGSRTLDTIEYQQVQAWLTALEEFSTFDEITGKVSLSRALYCLQQVLQQHSFQAKTKSSSVQILGVLEAAGLPFDYLWVMNLDGETWPPAPSPNPLLPIKLQVELSMPQSSAERERQYAQHIMQRFLGCADNVIYSSAKHQGDKQLAASPLISHVATLPFELQSETSLRDQIFQARQVERYTDVKGAPIQQPSEIRGGAQILKSQAACPFQAFARYRLLAKNVADPVVGLSPAEKGNLIHHVMEVVWGVLKTQATLISATQADLEALIADALEQAFLALKKKRFIGPQLVNIECARIRELVMAWLVLEQQREPFNVALNETSETINLNNLPIKIRYDRVDKLNDGTLFVLDYKTGDTHISSWAGSRPDDPQVPLYALANKQRVTGVAFGQISAKGVEIKGIGESENIAPGVKTPEMLSRMDLPDTWQDIIAHWQLSLEKLAEEFLQGDARVMPKNLNLTCRYCELQPLCRIHQYDNDSKNKNSAEA